MDALKIEQINEKINSLAGIDIMSIIMTISLVIHVFILENYFITVSVLNMRNWLVRCRH